MSPTRFQDSSSTMWFLFVKFAEGSCSFYKAYGIGWNSTRKAWIQICEAMCIHRLSSENVCMLLQVLENFLDASRSWGSSQQIVARILARSA
eukprot:2588046-Amphidinium_carterae.1